MISSEEIDVETSKSKLSNEKNLNQPKTIKNILNFRREIEQIKRQSENIPIKSQEIHHYCSPNIKIINEQ